MSISANVVNYNVISHIKYNHIYSLIIHIIKHYAPPSLELSNSYSITIYSRNAKILILN